MLMKRRRKKGNHTNLLWFRENKCLELKEKLLRSIVGETTYPLNIGLIRDRLFFRWYTIKGFRQMGLFNVLITFSSKRHMKDAIASGWLLNKFLEIY